jgi:hypothetical protein
LLEAVLSESEKGGVGSLKSLEALSRGMLLTVNAENQYSDNPPTLEVQFYSNRTLRELRAEFAKMLGVAPELIELFVKNYGGREDLPDLSRTITDGIKLESLAVCKREVEEVEQVELLDGDMLVP